MVRHPQGEMNRRLLVIALPLLALIAGAAWFSRPLPPERIQAGHRLSEWLQFYDSSWRFETNDGRHPPFTDAEIARALDTIGTNALPFLRRWLVTKPDRFKPWANRQLCKLDLTEFRFAVEDADYQCLAIVGFLYYGSNAQALLPWLLELSHSRDPELRALAYAAAFFTLPEQTVFLPLADRALQDPAANREAKAAQWMVERFPEEAAKRNLRARFPAFYHEESATDAGKTPSAASGRD